MSSNMKLLLSGSDILNGMFLVNFFSFSPVHQSFSYLLSDTVHFDSHL